MLTEPVTMPRPDMNAEALALEQIIVGYFDGHDLSLPPLPRVPELVLQMLANPKCQMADVAAEIGEDQVCAAAVLRLANSPLYRGLDRITGLQQAVVRLGAAAIRTLMMHQTMRSITAGERRGTHRLAEILSLRALAGGAVMRSLSRFTGLDAEEASLMGLLHDIGSIIVLRIINSQRAFSVADIDMPTFEYLCFEAHQEFGELLSDAWSLPPRLKSLITDHHRHPEQSDPLRAERLQLQLTDMIGSLLGFAPEAPYDLLESRIVKELGLARRADFARFLATLPSELEETMQAFDS
jgi:HD-like signal output (HDOD) protein